jgi:hypothetical protein
MNKFQAMAQIMAILTADGQLKRGSQKYKIARKLIETRIGIMGPDAAYAQAKWARSQLLVEIEEFEKAERAGKILSNFI